MILNYIKHLKTGKIILWCYFIWYCVIVFFYFDPNIKIWLNSIGISVVIGFALQLSVAGSSGRDNWQTFRLFAMPFCVSSFSALIKGRDFILIVPPNIDQLSIAIGACLIFLVLVYATKYILSKKFFDRLTQDRQETPR